MGINLDGPHVLYRLCDSDRRLLYVGITLNPLARIRDHRDGKDWWDQVSEIYLERFASRAFLMIAEQEAIRVERPLYNVIGNDRSKSSSDPFDVYPCPVCKVDSFYRRQMDRFYHLDGSDNIDCWIECTRGNITIGAVNVFGREFTCRTWPIYPVTR